MLFRYILFLSIVFSSFAVTAQEGDFLIRRNASNTDQIPRLTDLDLLWDTEVKSVGSTITYNAANGEFNLAETGRYFIAYSDYYKCTSTNDYERINCNTILEIGGANTDYAFSSGGIRKNNSGSQGYINSGRGIINVTTANTKVLLKHYRVDDVTTTSEFPDRVGGDRSGVVILKLDDTWDYGRYKMSSNISMAATGGSTTITWGTTEEEDASFDLLAGNQEIDILTNNIVLFTYAIHITGGTARFEGQGAPNLAGAYINAGWDQGYIRNLDDWTDCSIGGAGLFDPTSGDNFKLDVLVRRNDGGTIQAQADGNIQFVELPIEAKAIIVEATTGDFNASATNFTWDTRPLTSTAYDHTAGDSDITLDSSGHYLCFANQATTSFAAATRAVPSLQFKVNSTEIETAGASSYNRNTTTCGYSAIMASTLLNDLAVNDAVYVYNDRIGTTSTSITSHRGSFSMLRLNDIFDYAAAPTTWGGEIDGIDDPAEINGYDPAEVNGI